MSNEIIVQIATGIIMTTFMWGLNGKLSAIIKSQDNHRDNIRELYQTKVDEDRCRERREACPGKKVA